jgi:bifunctional UDP-N-acetylglucosamine pyrophosphorylase/glucosamine-1-phosphate N-acetyltransferase
LPRLSNKNAQGEYYLTDLISIAARLKKKMGVLMWAKSEDLRGVNDAWELALAQEILNKREIESHAKRGVRFMDWRNTVVECCVEIGPDTEIGAGVVLERFTQIGQGSVIEPHSILRSATIGDGVRIKAGSVIDRSTVESGAVVGPYAHLRPDSVVRPGAKIGNFVELKNARIGEKTSIAHLSYVGDAEVGSRVNIGCGFVTCNFDGRVIDGKRKHSTIIEDDVFMGSDCQVIAPIKIGRGAYVASGSTVTENVEANALAIARSRQVNKPGYAKKLKETDR